MAKTTFLHLSVCALLLAACGKAPPADPVRHAPPGVYDPTSLDLNRPCTLVTEQDAAQIAGAPFFRTIAANLVDENNSVRCAQGVGVYGLHGLVEAEVRYAQPGATVGQLFDLTCRTPATAGETEDVTTSSTASATPAPAPVVRGRFCALQNGAYALALRDRIVLLRVRDSAGEIDPVASRRLASLVSARLVRN